MSERPIQGIGRLAFLTGLAVCALVWPGWAAVVADDIIDTTLQVGTLSGAADLTAELEGLIQQLTDDPKPVSGLGLNLTATTVRVAHFRGASIGTLAMCLPYLSGSLGDTGTPKGKLAARLREDVVAYLLQPAAWDWEYNSGSNTYTALGLADNPRIGFSWNHRWRGGPQWDKLHALWAYAYYTGDWALIHANWSFIKARYGEAYAGTDSGQRSCIVAEPMSVFRSGVNDFANGAIAYTRLAAHEADATSVTARAAAKTALAGVLSGVDTSWAAQTVYYGWDSTPLLVKGEWTPGYDLTPELGRWIHDQALATAQSRLDEAAAAGELAGHWWCGFLNHCWKSDNYAFAGEDRWGTESLSSELFLGRAWMLQETASALRAVKPWHTTLGSTPEYRDYLYLRNLAALIGRHGTWTWVAAY